jgi:hypothetical protein
MSGKPKRVAQIQSYVNRADRRSYGGVIKAGNGPSVGVTKNTWHNLSSRTHSKVYNYKFNLYRTPSYFLSGSSKPVTGPGKPNQDPKGWGNGCPANVPDCQLVKNWQPNKNFRLYEPAYYRGIV